MTIKTDTGALAIRSSIAQVESALSELDKVSAGIADLAERHPVDLVFDVASAKGMREAVAHRAAWRDPRLSVERARKAAKAPVLALGKDIDARAAWITEQLLLGEEPVDKQIKAEQERQETARREAALAESARITAIQEALADIHMEAMAVIGKPSDVILAKMREMDARVLDPLVFQESINQARAAKTAAIEKLEMAFNAAKHTESEAARVAAERAELEQLREAARVQKEKDEAAALDARLAEWHRIAVERKAADEAAAAERKRADEAAAVARAEADRIARAEMDARAAEIERQALERLAAERAERQAAEAEQERQRAAEAEEEAAKQAIREAAFAEFQANAERNRRLHDAAPKLLAALQRMVAIISSNGRLYMTAEQIEALDEANAAIAEATGDKP
jgi:hypothetical protein